MCGVVGIIGPKSTGPVKFAAAYEAYRGLLTLQHRGQDAAGILAYDFSTNKFASEKELGLVASIFNETNLASLKGEMAIGHTRYATTGSDSKVDLQPLVTGYPFGIGMAHNGNLVNYHELARKLTNEMNLQLLTSNDLEVFLHYFCRFASIPSGDGLMKFDFEHGLKAAKKITAEAIGAYALVGLIAGEGLFGLRDPKGIRPLVLGKKTNIDGGVSHCLVSESVVLNFLGYEFVRDVEPGEFIFITSEGQIKSSLAAKTSERAPCMFEWIYFSGAESKFEGKNVYTTRLGLGKVLARRLQKLIDAGEISPDIVCPVPDTSRTASISLAEELRLPYREALIKNRYIQRSFILNTQEARERAVELKLSPVRSEIEGKKILLVDDSIVRGTTSKKIIDLLKRYGASEVTLAVTCPPLRYACYYGIDFPSPRELIAGGRNEAEIAQFIGANRVIFLEQSDLYEAIGLPSLCMACLSGKYPTDISAGEEFARERRGPSN